jgi:hypothetical protein
MTFLEALYGSQYTEIKQNGKDGNKGRFNGNIFLTAFLLVALTAVILVLVFFVPMVGKQLGRSFEGMFGYISDRGIGKILALVFGGIIYFLITKTVGTEENFNRLVDNFSQYPEDVRNTANKRLLVPFFIALGVAVVFAFLVD